MPAKVRKNRLLNINPALVRPKGYESHIPTSPISNTKAKTYAEGRDITKYEMNAYTVTIFTSEMPLSAFA